MNNREKKLEESEQKYHSLIEGLTHIGIGIDIISNDYKILFQNQFLMERYGDFTGEICYEKYMNLKKPCDFCPMIKAIKNNRVESVEITAPDGKIYEVISGPYPNPDGTIDKAAEIILDITKRKNAEQKLKESEKKYRNILESIKEVYYEVDTHGNFTFLTDKFVELVGYPKKELLGFNYRKIVSKEDVERIYTILDNIQKKDIQEMLFEYTLVKKDGTKRFFENSVYLKYDSEGKKIGFYGLARDITERKKAEKKLKESEEKYRELVELLPDIVAEVNNKLEITYANSVAFKLFGYSQEDFNKGLKVIQMIAPEDLEKASTNMKKVFNGEIIEPIDYLLLKRDGTKFYGRINSRPIYKEGRITGMRCVISDVTERKKAEQKLKESEVKYRELVELLPDAISEIDTKFNLTYANSKAFELFGYSQEDFNEGLKVTQMIAPEDLVRAIKVMKRLFNGEIVEPQDYLLIKKDGNKFYGRINYRAIYEEGRIMGYRCVISDITRRKKAEEKIKESEVKYRDAYNLISFYKDVFTHDMNNILQNILTSVELLSLFLDNPEKSEQNKEILQILKSQVKRSANLILNVRKLTKLEETQIGTQSTEAISVLRKTIEFIKKSVQDRDILIEVEISFEKVLVQANELLVDIFENILLNAVKYNDNTQVKITIIISKMQKEGIKYLKIEFKDNGIGITDAAKEIIFKGGYKRDKKFRGMGLGLSLVKKIVESYNGEIWVEDRVPGDYSKGSNFVVIIPETV